MIKVETLNYDAAKFSALFRDIEESLKSYFAHLPNDAVEWSTIFKSAIRDKGPLKRGFQLTDNDNIVGFLIIYVKKTRGLIRHLYIMRGYDRENLGKQILQHAIAELKSSEGIKYFENSAFTFPEDYITGPLENLGFRTVQRINMICEPILKENIELPFNFSIPDIDKQRLSEIALLGHKTYKRSTDLSYNLAKRQGKLSLLILKKAGKTTWIEIVPKS